MRLLERRLPVDVFVLEPSRITKSVSIPSSTEGLVSVGFSNGRE